MFKKILHFGYGIIKKIAYWVIPIGNVILFESLNDYDGNSYEIYKYLIDNKYYKKYKMIWVARNIENIPNDGYCKKIKIYGHSLKNLYYENRAKYVFFDNNCPVGVVKKNCKRIYLTHGCPPLKNTIGKIDVEKLCDYCLCTSKNVKSIISKQFNVDINKIFISGLPRNDILFKKNNDLNKLVTKKYSKVIIWMPTFRKFKYKGKLREDSQKNYYMGLPLIETEDKLNDLNNFLKENDIFLIIKLHPGACDENFKKINYSNIMLLSSNDVKKLNLNIYSIFNQTDALISDYSSVVFDYMLLNKQIGYIIDDINEYTLGFAYENVLDYMPGSHIKSLEELKEFFIDVKSNDDKYALERNKISKFSNDYRDNNTERIVKLFIK